MNVSDLLIVKKCFFQVINSVIWKNLTLTMKHLYLILFLTLSTYSFAQIGINTEDPRALLDIKATNEINGNAGVMTTIDGLVIPRVTTLLVGADQSTSGQLVYLTATYTDTAPNPDVEYEAGFYVSDGTDWRTFSDGTGGAGLGQLILVNEGNGGSGYRLKDFNPANYGNIGIDAIDLSISEAASNTAGATGFQSFATGAGTVSSGLYATASGNSTIASGESSNAQGFLTTASGSVSSTLGIGTIAASFGETALGRFNIEDTNSSNVFVIGNGTNFADRSNAFQVTFDGVVTAPSLTVSEIDAASNRTLITKEYFEINDQTGTAGLERITENGVLGYRRTDADPDNFGNIGSNAIDLSASLAASTTRGATGNRSTSMGAGTTASGDRSTAMGRNTIASGTYSTAIGFTTTARSESETSMGTFNTNYTVAGNNTDRLFVLGNGSEGALSDALIILKNGTLTAPSLSIAEINAAGNKALITKEYLDANGFSGGTGGSGGLVQITEGGNTGYRRSDASAANFGNIGDNAVDLGTSESTSTTLGATGLSSFSAGQDNTSSNSFSTSMGRGNIASGFASTALGDNNMASGESSVVGGVNNVATGDFSTAFGSSTTANGLLSTATGFNTTASGGVATAMGQETTASGINSTASGFQTVASGETTFASGDNTFAQANSSFSAGRYNTNYTVADNGTDRLFIVGVGANNTNRADGLIVQLDGTITAPSFDLAEITDDKALITKEYFDANNAAGGSGELAEVTEGGNTGYRLADANSANYGNIGNDAVDLSIQNVASSITGATGDISFAVGENTTASGDNSVAIGLNNLASGDFSTAMGANSIASGIGSTAMGATEAQSFGEMTVGYLNTTYTPNSTTLPSSTDRLFTIGNGEFNILTSAVTRSDALIVLKNGTITAPSFDLAEITDDKALITKEYFDANNTAGAAPGLENITEGGSTGYRRSDADEANYGDIGNNAIDLTFSANASTTLGATGTRSFASGNMTTASGTNSFTSGWNTLASGNTSTAMGIDSQATGDFSLAMGIELLASAYGTTVFGNFNDPGTTIDATFPESGDQIFSIGNGGSPTLRSNALTILRNGTITAPSLSISEIDAAGDTALTTKEFSDENYIGRLPSGSTAARPATAPAFGTMRYNTDIGRVEVYVANSTAEANSVNFVAGWRAI
jgi:hypothetical protein